MEKLLALSLSSAVKKIIGVALLFCVASLFACLGGEVASAAAKKGAFERLALIPADTRRVSSSGEFLGRWAEKRVGRGLIEIKRGSRPHTYDVNIHWKSSAAEASVWTMTAFISGPGAIAYDNCRKVNLRLSETAKPQETEVYVKGKGSFVMEDSGLVWHDMEEDAGGDTVFVRAD